MPTLPRIFVRVTNYRDAECLPTITDLFAKAAHPERVFVGICTQYDKEREPQFANMVFPRNEQVRVVEYDYRESKGANWARLEAVKLWRGEEYVLMMDSHMRFAQGWDDIFIRTYEACPTKDAVVSVFPGTYVPESGVMYDTDGVIPLIRINQLDEPGGAQVVHLTRDMHRPEGLSAPMQTPFYIGCCMFAPSRILQEVPYDPYIYFYGDEPTYSARLWTHGWDIYQPIEPVVWHYWPDDYYKDKEYKRLKNKENIEAARRVNHILGLKIDKNPQEMPEIVKYGMGKKRPLEVLWKAAGIDFSRHSVSEAGTKGEWNWDMVKAEGKPRIFVSIASYRDPECQHTVADLFAKAKYPGRVFAGICWQIDLERDGALFQVPYKYPKQVREQKIDWREAEGVCWARSKVQELYDGEEYILQIDSHMRFVQDWDELMIKELAATGSKKPVLSCSIAKYTPPNDIPPGQMTSVVRAGVFNNEGNIRNQSAYLSIAPKQPLNSAFLSAGFIFAKAEMFSEVPYDPYLYFDQEEISLAMRLYTHGWDIFSTREPLIFHYYSKPGESTRPLHWNDALAESEEMKKKYRFLRDRGKARFDHLSAYALSEQDEVVHDLDLYGLGDVRTLEEYETYTGIDFSRKKVSEYALRGKFIKGLEKCLKGPLYVPELDDKGKEKPACLMSEQERLNMHKLSSVEAPKVAQTIAPLSRPRIFVQIASYRDAECQHTVKNLFDRAAHPERIFAGICWHLDESADGACFDVPYPYPKQVRERRFPHKDTHGMNWARAQAQSLWQGEEYVLQIDSHMRFEQGWDELLIDMLKRSGDAKGVISTLLPGYKPGQELKDYGNEYTRVRVQSISGLESPAIVHLAGEMIGNKDARVGLYPSPFILGNFMFTRAEAFAQVPLDPHIFFHGDEATHSLRLWTHGYNVYQPDRPVAYHYWVTKRHKDGDSYKSLSHPEAQRTLKRVRHLLGLEQTKDAKALEELSKYNLGNERDPEAFWAFAGVNPKARTLSKDAERGVWNMQALKEPKAKPRIFVQIAAYRDPECQHTVKELFENAKYPERIFAGICWQFVKGEDDAFFKVPYPRPQNVRVIEVDAKQSKGVCWARSQVQTLWQGEEYTLQIDSHMRFEKDWDETLLSMLAQCPGKAVLSTYPAGYEPPRTITHHLTYRLGAKQFDHENIFTMSSKAISNTQPPPSPVPGAFVGACMLFGPSSIIKDVPYDPTLYFFGEEITLSVRLWTHGYDIYHPQKPVMYHFWERKSRRTHFDDHSNWPEVNKISYARVRHLLGTEKSTDPKVIGALDKYGLGTARTLEAYQIYSGVNFATKTISEDAYNAVFPNGSSKPALPAWGSVERIDLDSFMKNRRPADGKPRVVLQTNGVIVIDDFLPEEGYQKLYDFAVQEDYQIINTEGKVKRVWDVSNGFPLRGERNVFYYADPAKRPSADYAYPSKTPYDIFIEQVNATAPQVEQYVGKPVEGFEHFSVTSWIYPPNTGLSMHDDGAGVYSGAYVYFLSPFWRPHWGGQLLVMDDETNKALQEFKSQTDAHKFHKKKWLHVSGHDEVAMEYGLAQCVMPKRNRIVFIAPHAYHMVTKVNPECGDNMRISLAGFFHRGKKS